MSDNQSPPRNTPPIENGPQTAIPQTDIPHMGTSQANVPKPQIPDTQQPAAQPQQPQAQQPQTQPQQGVQLPPLPPGVTQDAINAAIQQVEQTGKTDGIAPEVLAAACAQIEAHAAAQGIDLQAQGDGAQTGPSNYVEAAVMDKQGTMDNFAQQRESIRTQVNDQREAMQKPFQDALAKAGDKSAPAAASMEPEQMAELARAVQDLDPDTVALINALGFMSTNPSILNTIVWMEIIRAFRRLVAREVHAQSPDSPPALH